MPLRHNTLLSMVVFILYPYVQYSFAQCLPCALPAGKTRLFADGVLMRADPRRPGRVHATRNVVLRQGKRLFVKGMHFYGT